MSLGWGDGAWGADGWGGTLEATGNSASGAVGTAAPVISIALTGIFATGSVDSLTPSVFVGSGDTATGFVGTVGVVQIVSLTGVEAFGQVGTLTTGATSSLDGVFSSGEVGSFIPTNAEALTGVEGMANLGQVIVPLLPDTAIGEIGTLGLDRTVSLTGVSASGVIGLVSIGTRSFALVGNSASGQIGTVISVYWKLIDDSQSANWQNINNS
jgi:hypothetical protein